MAYRRYRRREMPSASLSAPSHARNITRHQENRNTPSQCFQDIHQPDKNPSAKAPCLFKEF
ncbi:hypothetical protein B0T16DRAFT_72777 [Cercophora newfieldiana]|uniref:Uncharacterized protein n=1 Tax=Cercophora newfieldiana TaxID=92897 RepID=A0AA39YEB0_9PEZI|nr:hypothetical protein B0T16DRAFT_72777 [Cercophora newfieldiana]